MPVEILWSPLARARLREIRAYVATDKPEAAERLATRIVAVVEALRNHPQLGRAGAEPGIRELVIGGGGHTKRAAADDGAIGSILKDGERSVIHQAL